MSLYFRSTRHYFAAGGYTFIELAMVIGMVAILSFYAITSFLNSGETRDASMVQSTQSALQQVISQGSVRLDKSPQTLMSENTGNVLVAVEQLVMENGGSGVSFNQAGGNFAMTIDATGRGASYAVTSTGDVMLNSLSGPWTRYEEANGVIHKR